MRKALIAVITAAVLFAVGAFAAELTVTSDNLASGQDDVAPCGDATVDWDTNELVPTTGGDWLVETATVRFSAEACDGAVVDMAVGLNTDTTAGADSWDNWSCTNVAAATNSSTCTPVTQPSVSQVVDVAVLANGNSVTTSA